MKHTVQGIDDMVTASEVISRTKVEPRAYQRRIVGKTLDMFMGRHKSQDGQFEPNARSILIESPTGSGKTVMGWLSIKCLQEAVPDLAVGWVAMRRNLLSQAMGENLGKGINVQNVHMVSMFDRSPEALLEHKRKGGKVALVVDEAQHDAANSMTHLHNILEPEYILGLSATPFRQDRMKLCFDKVIKDAGIHQLIQDGFLSKFDHFTIPNWAPETVAQHYLADPKRWGKSLFYFVNLEQCFQMAGILKSNGIVCDVVTGDTDVESQLAAFREGHIPALINCMKLTEGFDEPTLQTAWVRDSGKGPTMQMAGRAFRKHPSLRAKQVVQSKQTKWPIIRTALPDQQYVWQDSDWLSLKVNPKLNLINQNARLAIAQTEVELPTFLTSRAKGRPRRLRF